jgi:galactokinase
MTSDLPAAAGLSSSSALVVAAYLALAAADEGTAPAADVSLGDPLRLAAYLGAVENGAPFAGTVGAEGVGTAGGSEDHAAILASRAGEVAQFGYCPLRLERRLRWPPSWRLLVGASGVQAKKSGAALAPYNRLSTLADEAAAAWREISGRAAPTLGDALAAVGGSRLESDLAAARPGVEGAAIRRRARHFVVESVEVLPAAVEAVAAADAAALGRAAARSQEAAERWLGNQVAETIGLVRLAREQGAVAASAFGAGFGGATWAVVSGAAAAGFLERWQQSYGAAFPDDRAARFFAVTTADGAAWMPAPDAPAAAGAREDGE